MAKVVISLFVAYFMVGTMFLMMFMTGHLKLTMKSKKDREGIEGRGHLHIIILPILAISSILANKRSKKGGRQ